MTKRPLTFSFLALALLASCTPIAQQNRRLNLGEARELNREIDRLTRENQTLHYDISILKDRLDAQEQALGNVMQNVPPANTYQATPPPSPAPIPAPAAAGDPAADQLYHQATQAWADTKNDEARALFQEFQQRFPQDPRAPEALLNVGLSYYEKGDYASALRVYQQILATYPGFNREAEAAAQMGYSYIGLQQLGQARQTLEQVVVKYPNYELIDKVKQVLATLPPASAGRL